LLLEHGALFTFRETGAPVNDLGLVVEFPADLLREKGHKLILSSAEEETPFPTLLSFFLTFSSSAALLLLFFFLKISFHRLELDDIVVVVKSEVIAGDDESGF
jgi:hypothetical protein